MDDSSMTQDNQLLLEAKHFRKVYYPTVAVDDISMSISKGDILALVGANGAGKSTFTKAISGVIRCDEGQLVLTGRKSTCLGSVRLLHEKSESEWFIRSCPFART